MYVRKLLEREWENLLFLQALEGLAFGFWCLVFGVWLFGLLDYILTLNNKPTTINL